ncbi:hypothetical protein [Clostridium sp. DL1XJH146]
MAKPSMFSKDYDKKMRKIKKRRRFSIVTILIIALFSVLLFKGNIGNTISSVFTSNVVNNDKEADSNEGVVVENKDVAQQDTSQKESDQSEMNQPDANQPENTNEENVPEELAQPEITNIEKKIITLSNNGEVIVSIKTDNEVKTIEAIEGVDLQYSINAGKQKAVLLDKDTSRLLLIDTFGTVTDITNPQYVSSSKKVYTKEDRLKTDPEYIWVTQPVFLNDNTVVYLSNLPWFNKNGRLYLWQYTIDSGKHISKDTYNGMTITYGQITENGLELNIDGEVKYLK